jgi:hypothetical protein
MRLEFSATCLSRLAFSIQPVPKYIAAISERTRIVTR